MTNSGKWLRTSFFWLLITLAIVVIVVFIFHPAPDIKQVNVSIILNDIKADIAKGQKDTLNVENIPSSPSNRVSIIQDYSGHTET